MPLLHRKPFEKTEVPDDLRDEEEVFHCVVTKEIFRDYEEYFKRVILCNSLVWSCTLTGKSNLTYQEALDSEKEAAKKIKDFPKALEKPLLFLVGLAQKSRIDDLNEELLNYIKNRYFVGETVSLKKQRYMGKVVSVLPFNKSENDNMKMDVCEDEDEEDIPLANFKKTAGLQTNEVQYEVLRDNMEIKLVPASELRRPLGQVTRERCKIFLKLNCYQELGNKGIYIVKDVAVKKHNLRGVKWSDIHTGSAPVLTASPKNDKNKKISNEKKSLNATEKRNQNIIKKKVQEMRDKIDQDREEKKREREEMRRKKIEEAEKIKQILQEERDRKKREKDEMREKLRQDKRLQAEKEREWNRPRDDLLCDDLKVLPEPKLIETSLSHELFGSVLSLMEFFSLFEDLFDAKDEFPNGVTVALVEQALTDESHESPLCDFLFFFLSNIFRTTIEEEGEKFYELQPDDRELAMATRKTTDEHIAATASIAATWPENFQGYPLNKLELDSYTVSEILRLYLITSAARPASDNRCWRYQQRGGYTCADEIPMRFCMTHSQIVQKLASTCIFNCTPDEKMQLLLCLRDHLLTFVTAREFMDEMYEKLQAAQTAYREDKFAEKRREKEAVMDRMKWKSQQQTLMKENKMKEVERRIKAIQAGRLLEREIRIESEEDIDQQKIFSPLETIEYLRSLDEEEKEAVEAWKVLAKKHEISISKLEKNFRVKALGQDRYYRRYWTINCIPGIFVEEFVDEELTHDFLRIKVPQKVSAEQNGTNSINFAQLNGHSTSNGYKLMNEHGTILKPFKISIADCNSYQRRQGIENRWYIYESVEEVDNLIGSLNMRGHREMYLHHNLLKHKASIAQNLKNPQHSKLSCRSPNSSLTNAGSFELAFRDQLLEFEERIWFGTLGILNSENRENWRLRMTNGEPCHPEIKKSLIDSINETEVDDEGLISPPYVKEIFTPKVNCKEEDSESSFQLTADEIAIALLQVSRGIDHKYLKSPLGCSTPVKRKTRSAPAQNDKEKERQKSEILLARWETSLIQCTSISQVSLHLSTLDRSIIWAKSLLNASCRICRRKGDDERMLLCDMCDRGHHMYCLKPPLKNVPPGNWFCPDCKPKAPRASPRKMPRKISFSQGASSDETTDSSEEEEEESEDDGTTENVTTEEEDIEEKEPTPPRKSIAYKFTNKAKAGASKKKKQSRGTKRSSIASNGTRRTSGVWKELNVCQDILLSLTKHVDAWPFLEPVNKKKVPDYYDIIKNPMDYNTIRLKLMNGSYTKPTEFVSDVILVFENCLIYNVSKSAIAKAAISMRQEFENHLRCNNMSQYIAKRKRT